ncbi:GntR family transcriptional regulator [Stutzerimonas stutzeri]|nr:GntR family transcriptional regulator [Stutzerimonas stutzeri]
MDSSEEQQTGSTTPLDVRLVDVAFERLEEMIVTRQLPPNTMVSELQLSAELKMGRTPIREALQRLRQIGFVEMQPRRGTMVCGTDIRQQLELLEVRRPLEELVARCAALRASDEERRGLSELSKNIRNAAAEGDVINYLRINRQIHEKEVQAAHNGMLTNVMAASHAQSRRFWYQNIQQNKAFDEGADCHSRVLEAIIAGNVELAIDSVRDLMQFLERLTRSTLAEFSNSSW